MIQWKYFTLSVRNDFKSSIRLYNLPVCANYTSTRTMTSKIDHKQAVSLPKDDADEKAKKEELVEARIKMMKKKNEELMKRQQEIEEDRRNANKYSEMVVIKKHVSGVIKESPGTGRGRGRGRGLLLEEMRKETLKAKQWEAKRRENILKEEQERNQRSSSKTSSSPSRFLADDSRVDMSKMSGRNEHSWGGANFNKAVNRMQREKESFRSGRSKGNIEMTMSGRERHQYYQWKEERTKIDEERKARQKKAGNWSRAWDQRKIWDSRRKIWVYEDDADIHNEGRGMRQERDSSEDWGTDNRSSRMDNRGRGRGEQGSRRGFPQHHDQEIEETEDWGDTSEKTVIQNKLPGLQTETDNAIRNQPCSIVDDLGSTDWEVETPTLKEQEISCIAEEAQSDHPHSNALSSQRELKLAGEMKSDSAANDRRNNSQDSHTCKSQESANGVTSDPPHSDAPKPQREPRQRKLNDTEVNEDLSNSKDSHKEQGLATKKVLTSDENYVPEPSTGDKESDVASKVHEHIHKESKAISDHLPSGDGDDKGTSLPVDEMQDTTNLSHSKENVQANEDKDNVSNSSQAHAHKANLPKLVTKIDKKVTFDTEENDCKTDLESKEMAVSLDIPPTPDFLKLDQSVDWGDIEVDEDEVVERWQ